MPIDTRCPSCQAKLRIGDEFAGQQARCPVCQTIYLVPEQLVAQEPVVSELVVAEEAVAASDAAPVPNTAVVEPVATSEPLPPPDGTRWYLRTPEGPIYGPVTPEVFDRWVQEGRVTPDCHVCAGDHAWRPAPELFPQISAGKAGPVRPIEPESWKAGQKPHRGMFILALGLMSIITTCPIPGVMAWVLGSQDLLDMQNGRMDPSGHGATQAGRWLGMILSLIYVGVAVIGTFVVLLMMAR
jgi:hypothetical protein